MDSFISHLLVCTEMSSTFYDVLKLKKSDQNNSKSILSSTSV